MIGTIKKYFDGKGYGFVARDDGGDEVFFHISAFEDAGLAEPAIGDRIEFDLGPSKNGKTRAVNLKAAAE
jgi:cold shock protein